MFGLGGIPLASDSSGPRRCSRPPNTISAPSPAGSKAEFDFTLSNLYVEDVHIVTAYSSCGCTSVDVVKPTLKTYRRRGHSGGFQYADLPRIAGRHDYRDYR